MLLSALIALNSGQIQPIGSTIAIPPDNQTALYCVERDGYRPCFEKFCDAYPSECTAASVPTFLLKPNQPQLDRVIAGRSCIVAVGADGRPYLDCVTTEEGAKTAALPHVLQIALISPNAIQETIDMDTVIRRGTDWYYGKK